MDCTKMRRAGAWKTYLVSVGCALCFLIPRHLHAQLAKDKCKFLGNVIAGSVPSSFSTYWNQVTPENAGKWQSVESTMDDMVWTQLDLAYNYAKDHGIPFKQHTFVWGQQQPDWIASLSAEDQAAQVEEWIKAYGERYPDTDFIDVVNEPLHASPAYAAALGGSGTTGWDWVILAFEKAREYCPNAKLLINEYNILNGYTSTASYLEIINLLKERELIDGIGLQGHSLEDTNINTIKTALNDLAATGLPIYISEYEARGTDSEQLAIYKEQFPVFWQHNAVHGITLWGYINGQMWRNEGHLLNGTAERPALVWLKDYMKTASGGVFCLPVTGINDDESGLRVHPNPATDGKFTLELTNGVSDIRITDLNGRLIKELRVSGERTVDMDLKVAPGIYVLQIITNHRTTIKKLAVQ